MTYPLDVAGGRHIVARWCTLAEQRLQYLTELLETGRWRRFYSEPSFRENLQEAKDAVNVWRDLLSPGTPREKSAPEVSRIGATVAPPSVEDLCMQIAGLPQQATEISPEPPANLISIVRETKNPQPGRAAPAPAIAAHFAPTISSMGERHPLLRNSL